METQRREALAAVKQAVRAYVREPTPAHAKQVETAWRRVRQLDSIAQWRHGPYFGPRRSAARLAS
jgi:hypothetical protein